MRAHPERSAHVEDKQIYTTSVQLRTGPWLT